MFINVTSAFVGFLALFVPFTPQQDEVVISERFPIEPGATLRVDVSHAEFEILTGDFTEAHVEVSINSSRMSRALGRFDEMNWRVTQQKGDIVIMADKPRTNFRWGFDIDVVVRIPRHFHIDMVTSHGDVELGDVDGNVSLGTSHGDVELRSIRGDRVALRSSHGDVTGHTLAGQRVEVHTSHADIEFGAIDSREFEATTSHADVEIGTLRGASRIRTSHGDISVDLEGVQEADLDTSHGNVVIYMDTKSAMDVDLRGDKVDVARSFALDGRVSDDRIEGRINGGGPLLRVRTSHGRVVIR